MVYWQTVKTTVALVRKITLEKSKSDFYEVLGEQSEENHLPYVESKCLHYMLLNERFWTILPEVLLKRVFNRTVLQRGKMKSS